ncbi:MAG: hypothetical protein MJ131_10925 [Lachnospiraceae bacterium]|nr:hypothetical protein [Lachnospiraceae bacterium]
MVERGKVIARHTVFDDVFRTICQKMPKLLIPIINEAFGTKYLENESVIQLRNEYFELRGTLITDSVLSISGHTYHIECQSNDDSYMVVRMFEYDYSIALEQLIRDEAGNFIIKLPESCVVYLRDSESVSRQARLKLLFPDDQTLVYQMKTICVQDYTKDDIFEKRLLMFLPYYILRYKEIPSAKKSDRDKLSKFLTEFREIQEGLEAYSANDEEKAMYYSNLCQLITKVGDYIIKSEAVKRRVREIMGGKVLKLQTEIWFEQGLATGEVRGEARGRELERKQLTYEYVSEGDLSLEKGAKRLGITVEELKRNMLIEGYTYPEQ